MQTAKVSSFWDKLASFGQLRAIRDPEINSKNDRNELNYYKGPKYKLLNYTI